MELRPEKLPQKRIYALDTVTLIYFLERHPHFYRHAKALFQRIEAGEILAVFSSLVFAELLVPAFRSDEKQRVQKIVRILSNFPTLRSYIIGRTFWNRRHSRCSQPISVGLRNRA